MASGSRILITGCSGFIGSELCRQAAERGFEVAGLDIQPCTTNGVDFIKGSITDRRAVDRAVDGADVVIHLAAITSNVQFEKEPALCYATNVTGFMNVIDAASAAGCKRFLYASSAAVYTDTGFSEDSVLDINKQRNHYAKSKLMNEMVAQSYMDIRGLDVLGMRIFNVFGLGENGKGDYASVVYKFLKADMARKPIIVYGDGAQARDFIFVSDAAKIMLKLLKHGRDTIFNVGTGRATSYGSIADMINPKGKKFVKNPLSSYQRLTKADTRRLLGAIGDFKFTTVRDGIALMRESMGGRA